MVHFSLPPLAKQIFSLAGALTVAFTAGIAAGVYVLPQLVTTQFGYGGEAAGEQVAVHATATSDEGEEHPPEDDHLALTKQAFENLQLEMGYVVRGDYWRTIVAPGRVVGIPGRSGLSVSAPVTGIVEQVEVREGESLAAGQALFEIRLTDESLATAQSELLQTLIRQEVHQKEIARLAPLTRSGTVSAAKSRELEYALRELQEKQATLQQELRGRGLPEPLISQVIEQRRLVTRLTVVAPPSIGLSPATLSADRSAVGDSGYSVAEVGVNPGTTVARGQELCRAVFHRELFVEGVAFEDDLILLDRIQRNQWPLSVEPPDSGREDSSLATAEDLELLRIDNQVNETTQTVRFYAMLPNQITASHRRDGRAFNQWQFRPGQRLHVRLPVEHWSQQLALPVEAVAMDGFNAYVFAEHRDEHDEPIERLAEGVIRPLGATEAPAGVRRRVDKPDLSADLADPLHHDVYIELEPIPVNVLHRDDKTVVIADDGQLPSDVRVALNHAVKLHLAMKLQGAGGGAHHHHDH